MYKHTNGTNYLTISIPKLLAEPMRVLQTLSSETPAKLGSSDLILAIS